MSVRLLALAALVVAVVALPSRRDSKNHKLKINERTMMKKVLNLVGECKPDVNPQDCRAAALDGDCRDGKWAWDQCHESCGRCECKPDVNPQDCAAAKRHGDCSEGKWAWDACHVSCQRCDCQPDVNPQDCRAAASDGGCREGMWAWDDCHVSCKRGCHPRTVGPPGPLAVSKRLTDLTLGFNEEKHSFTSIERKMMKTVLDLLEGTESTPKRLLSPNFGFDEEEIEKRNGGIAVRSECVEEMTPLMVDIYHLVAWTHGDGDKDKVEDICERSEDTINNVNLTAVDHFCDWIPERSDYSSDMTDEEWEESESAHVENRHQTKMFARWAGPVIEFACSTRGRQVMLGMQKSRCGKEFNIFDHSLKVCNVSKDIDVECDDRWNVEACVLKTVREECGSDYMSFYGDFFVEMMNAAEDVFGRECQNGKRTASKRWIDSCCGFDEETVSERGLEKRGNIGMPVECEKVMKPISIGIGRLVGHTHGYARYTDKLIDRTCKHFENETIDVSHVDDVCIAPTEQDFDNSTDTPEEIQASIEEHETVMKTLRRRARLAGPIINYACSEEGREVMREMQKSPCAKTSKMLHVQKNCEALGDDLDGNTCEQLKEKEQCVVNDLEKECGSAYHAFYAATYHATLAADAAVNGRTCDLDGGEESSPEPPVDLMAEDSDLLIENLKRALKEAIAKKTEIPCEGMATGQVDKDPNDCSRYYVCVTGSTPMVVTCPAGHMFLDSMGSCVLDPNAECLKGTVHGKSIDVNFEAENLFGVNLEKASMVHKRGVMMMPGCITMMEPVGNTVHGLMTYIHDLNDETETGVSDESLLDETCERYTRHMDEVYNQTIVDEECSWVPEKDDIKGYELTDEEIEEHRKNRDNILFLAGWADYLISYACSDDGRDEMQRMRSSPCKQTHDNTRAQEDCGFKRLGEEETNCTEQAEIEECCRKATEATCGAAYGEFYNEVYGPVVAAAARVGGRECPEEVDEEVVEEDIGGLFDVSNDSDDDDDIKRLIKALKRRIHA